MLLTSSLSSSSLLFLLPFCPQLSWLAEDRRHLMGLLKSFQRKLYTFLNRPPKCFSISFFCCLVVMLFFCYFKVRLRRVLFSEVYIGQEFFPECPTFRIPLFICWQHCGKTLSRAWSVSHRCCLHLGERLRSKTHWSCAEGQDEGKMVILVVVVDTLFPHHLPLAWYGSRHQCHRCCYE